jgi:hypothetical protein
MVANVSGEPATSMFRRVQYVKCAKTSIDKTKGKSNTKALSKPTEKRKTI